MGIHLGKRHSLTVGGSSGRKSSYIMPTDNLLAYYDHQQGVDSGILYDKSGNGKNGTLGTDTKKPGWSSEGNTYTGAELIKLPVLKSTSGPVTIFTGYKQTEQGSVQGQLYVPSLKFMNIYKNDLVDAWSYFPNSVSGYSQYSIWHTEWRILAFAISGTTCTVYQNGVKIYVGTFQAQFPLAANIELGRVGFKGINGVHAFYGAALNDSQQLDMYRYLAQELRKRSISVPDTKYQVICDGDSITTGAGATFDKSYPYLLMGLNKRIATVNLGINGQKIETMLANAPTKIDTLYMSTGVEKSVVVVWGGSNDLAVYSRTDVQTYNDIVSYCTGRRTAGFKVIVLTILKRYDCIGSEETYRQSVNSSIRSNWSTFADVMVDADADSRFDDYNDTTYFYTDKIHLNATGYGVMAALINTAVQGL